MTQQGTGITRWVLRYALTQFFHSDKSRMASALNMSVDEINQATTNEGARIGAPTFDKLVQYCARKEISMDDILAQYKEKDE